MHLAELEREAQAASCCDSGVLILEAYGLAPVHGVFGREVGEFSGCEEGVPLPQHEAVADAERNLHRVCIDLELKVTQFCAFQGPVSASRTMRVQACLRNTCTTDVAMQ